MSTTFTFANTWLAWRLGGFQVEHPDLAVRLLTGNQLVALTATAGFRDWLVSAPGRRNLPKIKRFREWLVDRTAAERKAS